MRVTRTPAFVAWCVAVVLLLVGTTMPGSAKHEIESHLWQAWPWSASAHFVLFAFIAGVPVYGRNRAWPLRALAVALALAVLTEWLQSFVPGRNPLVRDGMIDLAGAATGMLASVAWESSRVRTRDSRRA